MDLSDVKVRIKRKNKIFFNLDSSCLQEVFAKCDSLSKLEMASFMLEEVKGIKEVLYVKFGDDVLEAYDLCERWFHGEIKMPLAKRAILKVHALAKESDGPYYAALLHAYGQALSCLHSKRHIKGLFIYELTALVYKYPDYEKDVRVTGASHWPTPVSLEEYAISTGLDRFPDYLDGSIRDGMLEVMANGTIDFCIKGVNARITVRWDFASDGGGDISTSVKKGTLSSLETVQNAATGFTRQLYVRKTSDMEDSCFGKKLEQALERYSFVSVVPEGDGVYLIDIPEDSRTGHEEHFAEVAADFLHYAARGRVPEQEVKNTLSKYYITTEGVSRAKNVEK